MWVPVKTTLRVLALRMEERPTRGGPQNLGLGEGKTNRKKTDCCKMLHVASEFSGSCEHGNETSASIKDGEFLD
jgi:hypothetical protein